MIVPPQTLAFPGAPAPELQLQQAGFDLTLGKIGRIEMPKGNVAALDLDNSNRSLPECVDYSWMLGAEYIEVKPEYGYLGGPPIPSTYLVTYNETITVPPDCAGMVLPRSSLMRCGAVLHSALWDPGYSGKGQGLLVVYHSLKLHRNARLAQFVLWRMEKPAAKLYEGKYQGENL